LTKTADTGMFVVKLKVIGSPSVTSVIVTTRAEFGSSYTIPSTGCSSILNSNAKSPRSPQSLFPETTELDGVGGDSCWLCAPALPGSAHTRQAAPTTMLTMPAIPRRRRLTSSPMGLCSLVPGPLCPAIPLHLGLTYGHTAQTTRRDARNVAQAHPSSSARCGIMPPLGHHSKQLGGGPDTRPGYPARAAAKPVREGRGRRQQPARRPRPHAGSAAVELGAEPPDLESVAHIARDEYAILVAHHH
jgi:hypothetical protein